MPATATATAKVVLHVEDQPVNAYLMEMLFERLDGVRLVLASSGQEALHLAPGLNPALLLLDLRLPDCHGTDLLRRLRALPSCAGVPAVAVTAEDGFAAEGTGFMEVWEKPINVAFVMGRVSQLCGLPPFEAMPRVPAAALSGGLPARNGVSTLSPPLSRKLQGGWLRA